MTDTTYLGVTVKLANEAADPIDIQATADKMAKLSALIRDADVTPAIEMFAFQGFDAFKMRQKILSRTSEHDIGFILTFAIMRGTTVKAKNRLPKETQGPLVKAMQAAKCIFTGGKERTPETVTVSRMVACFPEVVSDLMKKLSSTGSWQPTGYFRGLPVGFHFPSAASMISKRKGYLAMTHLRFCIRFSELIGGKQTYENVIKFWKAAYNSTMFNDDSRNKLSHEFSQPTHDEFPNVFSLSGEDYISMDEESYVKKVMEKIDFDFEVDFSLALSSGFAGLGGQTSGSRKRPADDALYYMSKKPHEDSDN